MSRDRAQPAPKEPFRALEMTAANGECANGTRVRPTRALPCPKCQIQVILHCYDCKIQVTACLCSEYARFGDDVAWKRAVERFGEQAARQRAEMAGLWVPPSR